MWLTRHPFTHIRARNRTSLKQGSFTKSQTIHPICTLLMSRCFRNWHGQLWSRDVTYFLGGGRGGRSQSDSDCPQCCRICQRSHTPPQTETVDSILLFLHFSSQTIFTPEEGRQSPSQSTVVCAERTRAHQVPLQRQPWAIRTRLFPHPDSGTKPPLSGLQLHPVQSPSDRGRRKGTR